MRRSVTLALAGLTATTCGALAWVGLSAVAAPSGFAMRRDGLEATVARLERTTEQAWRAPVHGAGAACPSPGDGDLAAVQRNLMTLADQAGAPLTDLVAAAPADPAGRGRLTAVTLRLQANGPYENVLALLEAMAGAQPEIFVDELDLTAAAPNVKLKLTGKVYCWTSARP